MDKPTITSKDGLFLLSGIPFHLEMEKIVEKFRIPDKSDEFSFLKDMLQEAEKTGVPKAVYRTGYIDSRSEDGVVINGIEFKSRVLRVNLQDSERVFMYVVSCGQELEKWSKSYTDPFFSYITDYIKESVLHSAINFFFDYIKEIYNVPKFSKMAPGSLKDWPIEQQRKLFDAIGDVEGTAGVVLTDSFLMVPSKSVSGIIFPTEVTFESCMLCPREKCPSRRAPYNSSLYNSRYRNT
ncbi:MAG: vitamin B12 dependent-methionine synthase activation domain-containing protein [Candidatus Ratteibacteria bacterium]|nr:vitamin B12 dependent-methionine synthase activation domain-containing protein [Candidatus Ratteibacteria bacterium]